MFLFIYFLITGFNFGCIYHSLWSNVRVPLFSWRNLQLYFHFNRQRWEFVNWTKGLIGNHRNKLSLCLWLKDGEELAASENVKIAQHGARCSVTIVCPEGEDSGMYICLAHNDSGHASCEAQLTVEEGETSLIEKIRRLQLVQNAASQFLTSTSRRERISPVLFVAPLASSPF